MDENKKIFIEFNKKYTVKGYPEWGECMVDLDKNGKPDTFMGMWDDDEPKPYRDNTVYKNIRVVQKILMKFDKDHKYKYIPVDYLIEVGASNDSSS